MDLYKIAYLLECDELKKVIEQLLNEQFPFIKETMNARSVFIFGIKYELKSFVSRLFPLILTWYWSDLEEKTTLIQSKLLSRQLVLKGIPFINDTTRLKVCALLRKEDLSFPPILSMPKEIRELFPKVTHIESINGIDSHVDVLYAIQLKEDKFILVPEKK
jgi:hypothetical protein